jgi:hypothetical protein
LFTFLFIFQLLFTEARGITKLVQVLSKRLEVTETTSQDEKIIEVILSILGNCTCNGEKGANQV